MIDVSKFFGFARYRRIPTVPCADCDWYRRVGSAGSVCLMHESLATLAHNLAIVAFGCRVFDLGADYGAWHQQRDCTPEPWEPGTGHSADHECIDCGAPMLTSDVEQWFRTCERCAAERRAAR